MNSKTEKTKDMNTVKRNTNGAFPSRMDNVLDRFLNDAFGERSTTFNPKVDISETDKAFDIDMAVPGFDKKDFDVDLKDGLLTISGERKFEKSKDESKNFYSIQTEYGTFKKSFQLPDNILAEKIEAQYNNGILSVSVPKDDAKKLASKISVK